MSVDIDVQYEGDLHCGAQHGPSGKMLTTDAPVDNGGNGDAFSPTDLVATALGTCVLTMMGIVAKRNNWDIRGTRCHVVKDMATAPTRRIGSLTAIITLPKGLVLSAADRAKLENAANICPVKQSLHPDVALKIEYAYPE